MEHSADNTRKLAVYGVVLFMAAPFGSYFGRVYWDNGVAGALLGFVLGVAITSAGLFLVGRVSNLFGLLAGERAASFSKREQLEADMQQARYLKMNKDFTAALGKINYVLAADPDYPEALFLKAQIVWEGFENRASALSNLRRIQTLVQDEDATVYRWADALLKELGG